jgi:HAMP domain-containing protein/signal transduction histidine kinase/CheY-like chemotaxis protein
MSAQEMASTKPLDLSEMYLAELLHGLQRMREGDFGTRLPGHWTGVAGKIADAFNEVIAMNADLAAELHRVGEAVGKHGKTNQRVRCDRHRGAWGVMEGSVNGLIDDLLRPMAEVTRSIGAVAKGDLSQRVPLQVESRALEGEFLRSANIVNTMIEQMTVFTSEVTRVAREVGAEGKLGGQAVVNDVSGVWKDLTDNVNSMADNLTVQVRNIAEVTIAVANGDLSRKITADSRGEILQLKDAINTMVEQLRSFASEVTRVAREVGTEGKLGGQATVPGVAGTWKDLTDNVNSMAGNLTAQVRNIAEVATAVAHGDLSRKVTVDVKGEILELKDTINTMVDQLNSFAAEVTRVAREVGTEGELGGQAKVPGVAGTWKDLTDNVNVMATNLTDQVRGIAEVATAIARGDLSRKITVDVKGEISELKDTINTMVDQLNGFAAEVTRVAREVGTDGKLGGQATVPGVAGTWKDLTDNVNSMAGNLTGQVRNIAEVTTAVARGDLSRKITVDVQGEILELKNTINTMVDQLNSFASEVTRVAREVGTEGELGGQAKVPGVAGTWKDLTDNVNVMAANLTDQVRGIAEVATAIARGDLSRKITVNVKGEISELKDTINTMVDQLNGFAAEVTRVAGEVGTEGRLGGQAKVPGVAGTWKDLTDNVNVMAANLTNQVRGLIKVVTAVANGDLTQKLTVESKGEVAALASTINSMTDTLAIFADQVTTVAREVGVEGRLGGQANVPGAAGTWKDLTANVNLLAANLTTQVRAIADVATAVTKGDLTRYIQVDASGEVADLKNYINAMIGNLRETTERNTEQDWLKTNLAKFSRMMQGQRDLSTVAQMLLSELAPLVAARQGVMYALSEAQSKPRLKQIAAYADAAGDRGPREYAIGEGMIGQCAQERQALILSDIPAGAIRISTGLIDLAPRTVVVLPVLFEGNVKAVIELASLEDFTASHLAFLEQLTDIIGIVLNNIEVTMRTEELLAQSQQLASEQQSQQLELQQTNEELALKARLLAKKNVEVERKNKEIEQARHAVEEKAAELALTSRYKSEFLANMSHELRTPLNSILVLGQQLAENVESNLTPRQVEFATTIRAAGKDLLNLISDILDLSKIESGTVTIECEDVEFNTLRQEIERNFRHEVATRDLSFGVRLDDSLGKIIHTDPKRLLQVIKNLLSNAFKFTDRGSIELIICQARDGWSKGHQVLDNADSVIAFSVRDTGMGIPPEKQRIVFEAFQQADAGTARKHGGTGLGLAISRELAQLLGGEIKLHSQPGIGSTFTLYLPAVYSGIAALEDHSAIAADLEAQRPRSLLLRAAEVHDVADDRDDLAADDDVLLIIEDEPGTAQVLRDLARERGFKTVVALRGAEGLKLAQSLQPTAISLDISLPDIVGWAVLGQLKQDEATRHIPVQILTQEGDHHHALAFHAFSLLRKPVTPAELAQSLAAIEDFMHRLKSDLLIVADGEAEQARIAELLGGPDIETVFTDSGRDGLLILDGQAFHCVVIALHLPDMSGLDLLESLQYEIALRDVPFILVSESELPDEERTRVSALQERLVLRSVHSDASLLNEFALFLHRKIDELPDSRREMLRELYRSDVVLAGKKILVVDDDPRNIFALSSVLERHGMHVVTARTGRDAIQMVERTPGLALVLLDIMMPGMDGYQTMQQIRANPEFRQLPIIALTAKAMKGDREKCLAAGASDYIAKPVDTERLVAVLRVWLYR